MTHCRSGPSDYEFDLSDPAHSQQHDSSRAIKDMPARPEKDKLSRVCARENLLQKLDVLPQAEQKAGRLQKGGLAYASVIGQTTHHFPPDGHLS